MLQRQQDLKKTAAPFSSSTEVGFAAPLLIPASPQQVRAVSEAQHSYLISLGIQSHIFEAGLGIPESRRSFPYDYEDKDLRSRALALKRVALIVWTAAIPTGLQWYPPQVPVFQLTAEHPVYQK